MADSQTESNPTGRDDLGSPFSFLTLPYEESIFSRLEEEVRNDKQFDGLIIDLMQTGFSMPIDTLGKFVDYGKKLLNHRGIMLFVKGDGAITLSRDDPGGGLVINFYDSPYGALTRNPSFAEFACATVSGIDKSRLVDGGGSLANHILLSSIPVLTENGIQAKSEFSLPIAQNWVIQLIDDYASVDSIIHKLEKRHGQESHDTLRSLQELENQKIIYPLFSRIEFLVNCYQAKTPFRLGRFMVACGILNEVQLRELLEQQREEGWGESQRIFLGVLAVRSGFINMRQLQVLLADQYLYGGYHRLSLDTESDATPQAVDVNAMRDSMIGSLSAIDAPGLLQSLANSSKTGLLSSEDRDRVLLVAFKDGEVTHAKMNKLKGFDSLVEFITSWSDGIFVFRDQGSSNELDDSTAINCGIDRILLDSALFHDNINRVIRNLPRGKETVLERVENFNQQFEAFANMKLTFIDEVEVTTEDRVEIKSLAKVIDGLSTVEEVVQKFDIWPAHKVYKAIDLLFCSGLLTEQKGSLYKPLSVFQKIVSSIREEIGTEANKVLLHSSLHYVHGDSQARSFFQIDHEGCVSVNLNRLKETDTLASTVMPDLRQWMEAYIAYCRQKLGVNQADEIISRIINEA